MHLHKMVLDHVQIDGTTFYTGQMLDNRKIATIVPSITSNTRNFLEEIMLVSPQGIIGVIYNYSGTPSKVERKAETAVIETVCYNGNKYTLGQKIMGMPISKIGVLILTDAPDTLICLQDLSMSNIDCMQNCKSIEMWYKQYSLPF